MLLNLSNHPSSLWHEEQINTACERWSCVQDWLFPVVDPLWSTEQVEQEAQRVFDSAMHTAPDAVLCQGEMTMTMALVRLFQRAGVPVVAATSVREVQEHTQSDGSTHKTAVFRFARFRAYSNL